MTAEKIFIGDNPVPMLVIKSKGHRWLCLSKTKARMIARHIGPLLIYADESSPEDIKRLWKMDGKFRQSKK